MLIKKTPSNRKCMPAQLFFRLCSNRMAQPLTHEKDNPNYKMILIIRFKKEVHR